MDRQTVGILGCAAVALGAVLAAAVAFGEQAIAAAGIPYHFLGYATCAAALFAVGVGCGFRSWATAPGKVAVVGGAVVGVALVGFVVLVLAAFATHG